MNTSAEDSSPPVHDGRDPRDPRRLIVFGVVVLVAAVTLTWLLFLIGSTLITIYISALFAMGISPLVQILERPRVSRLSSRLPRWLAILLIYVAIIGAIIAIGAAVIPPLVQQFEELWRAMPEKIEQGQAFLIRIGILSDRLTLNEAMQQAPAAGAGNAAATILGYVRNVVGGLFGAITILLLTFYMLVEARQLLSFFVRLFPPYQRRRVAMVSSDVTQKVSAWMSGQLLLSLIIGLTSALGLWAMGVPYFYVLALISAVGEMIPMVGPILAAIPAILVAATVSPGLAIGVAIFFIVQQQLENTILVPKLMGRQVGLSAVTVIVALAIGSQLLGIVGAILSVPTAAILQVLFEELVARDE
ncbi:MAG TPA: AI-2E family transporter [Vicinamibacterales bacterium]|nr:AI-2E family transporter [Vicinamibacterales bacterium]